MSNFFDTYQKRRLQSSYFSVVISIALVLFMVGCLGLVLLKSNKVANYFKEKVAITLFLKDDVSYKKIKKLQDSLQKKDYTKRLRYVSKTQAAREYSKDLGEDFLKFLGTNPLKNAIDLYIKADYASPEKMATLKNQLSKNKIVSEVTYDKPLIKMLTKNSKRIGFWLLIASAFFSVVAIILINSSIRLSIYSKRFNIKTMQMVGATKSFIRRPFIWQSIKLGFLGAFIALIGLASIIYYADKFVPTLALLKDYISLIYLAVGVLVSAFIITWLSTYFATRRFLNLKTDELYY